MLPFIVSSGVLCVDVSVEAELLVTGSDDGMVAVWSLADRQLVHSLLGHMGQNDVITSYRLHDEDDSH